MKRYFVWKDGKHNGKETEWIEVDESEYERIRSEEPARRFNQSFDDNNSAEDHFYYEVPEDEYKYWNRERMNYERHNKKVFGKNTVVSFDDLVDPNDEEGLTYAEIIPDTRDKEAADENAFQKWKEEMLGKIREIIKDMDEDTYDMFWKLVMNPDKDERMTQTEYADTKGVTQQAISKRLEKFLEKYRAQLGCKKKKRVLSK